MKRRRRIEEPSSRVGTGRSLTGSRWILSPLALTLIPLLISAEQQGNPHSRPDKNSKGRFQVRSDNTQKNNPHRNPSKNKNHKSLLLASSLASSSRGSNCSVRSTGGSRPKDDLQITYKFPADQETVLDDFDFDFTQPPSSKNKAIIADDPTKEEILSSFAADASVDTANSNTNNSNYIWNRLVQPWTITALVSGIFYAFVQAAAKSTSNQLQAKKKQPPKSRQFSWIKAGGETATTIDSITTKKATKPLSNKKAEKKPGRKTTAWSRLGSFKKTPNKKYSTAADSHPLALQSQAMIRSHGIANWIVSPEKLPWTLSALVSLVYLCALISRVSCDLGCATSNDNTARAALLCWKPLTHMTASLHEGFCVWGANPTTGVCASAAVNSHYFSFQVDLALAVITLVVGQAVHSNLVWVASIAILISVHGLLHLGISNGVLCAESAATAASDSWRHCLLACPGTQPTPTQPWQWVLYTLYNLGLVTLDVRMANFPMSLPLQYASILVVTAIFVAIGSFVGALWALPAVFVQSHVLVSVTGIFANQDKITPLMGWCFLIATIVGLVEFLACEPILLPHAYGHVAYDATLHIAMMASLIPRPRR
jgi:hypothetical protein